MRGRVGHPRSVRRRVAAGVCVIAIAGMTWAAAATAAPDAWFGVRPLGTARFGAVSVVLSSGQVLVAGGTGSGATSLASSEIFDPTTGTWSAGPDMTAPRSGAAGVLLRDGDVLIAGGGSGATRQTAELYDPNAHTFTATGSLNEARIGAGIGLLGNGKALVVGGDNSGTIVDSTELYDSGTGQFIPGPDMSTPRDNPLVASLADGDVLVAGGTDQSTSALASAEEYDVVAGRWSPTANAMSVPRDAGAIAPIEPLRVGGPLLVAGGLAGAATTTSADSYDPSTRRFTPVAPMAHSREAFGMAPLPNGDVVVAGGDQLASGGSPTVLDSTEVYDPVANAWSPGGDLLTPIDHFTMVPVANGDVLEAGGTSDLSTPTAQAAEFDPAFAPRAPIDVTAAAGDGSAVLTWADDRPSLPPVTSYTVTASTGQMVTVTGGAAHTTVTNLANGTPVRFTVTATNSAGTSPPSAPSAAVTPTGPAGSHPPKPPADKAAKLRLSRLASKMTLKRFLKGLRFTVTPSKAAALQVTLTAAVRHAVISRSNLTLASKRFRLSTRRRSVRLVPSRRLVGHPKSAKVRLTVVAVDASGKRSTVTRTVTVKG